VVVGIVVVSGSATSTVVGTSCWVGGVSVAAIAADGDGSSENAADVSGVTTAAVGARGAAVGTADDVVVGTVDESVEDRSSFVAVDVVEGVDAVSLGSAVEADDATRAVADASAAVVAGCPFSASRAR